MTDFEKGVEFAFEYIKKNMIGMPCGYGLQAVVTEERLQELRKTIPLKCGSCPSPCEQSWCSTVKE